MAMYVYTQHRGAVVQVFGRGKEKCIIYSECVYVALGFQHAMRMRHIVICSLSGFTMLATLFKKLHD
jgi:hypothetical protein